MKRKVIILADNVCYYMRFSTEEQANEFNSNYLILHKSELLQMFEELKNKIIKNQKIPNLLNERIDKNGIF